VPADAVAKRRKNFRAFVVKKGEVEERIVQVGPEPAPGQVSILSGLDPGDKVVTGLTVKDDKVLLGKDELADGRAVVE